MHTRTGLRLLNRSPEKVFYFPQLPSFRTLNFIFPIQTAPIRVPLEWKASRRFVVSPAPSQTHCLVNCTCVHSIHPDQFISSIAKSLGSSGV